MRSQLLSFLFQVLEGDIEGFSVLDQLQVDVVKQLGCILQCQVETALGKSRESEATLVHQIIVDRVNRDML